MLLTLYVAPVLSAEVRVISLYVKKEYCKKCYDPFIETLL